MRMSALMPWSPATTGVLPRAANTDWRSEEHTSELQSQSNLVCRLLLEKKKNQTHGRHMSRLHPDRNHAATHDLERTSHPPPNPGRIRRTTYTRPPPTPYQAYQHIHEERRVL